MRRCFEPALAAIALVALSPVLAFAAFGILLADGGPIFYRAMRIGLNGHPFVMYKFRTMRTNQGCSPSRITAPSDPRTFPFGALLRHLKIDELPQFFNIAKGDMAFVGPRPEDPRIVRNHYTMDQLKTLQVRPGLASPGTLYEYSCSGKLLSSDNTEACYVQTVLPLKLALDLVYIREASLLYDCRIALRTLRLILSIVTAHRTPPDPPEMKKLSSFRIPAPRPSPEPGSGAHKLSSS